MFWNYIKIALRHLKQSKIFSAINILGLAVGLASAFLIFFWIMEETGYDKFNTKRDRIYRVVIDFDKSSQASLCGALAPAISSEVPEIENTVRIWSGWDSQIYFKEHFFKSRGRFADPSIFDVFTFPFIEGNPEAALIEKHSIVITESVAKKLFGDESAVGKIVQIKNRDDVKEDFKISGVIKDVPVNSHIQFEFLFSFKLLDEWYRQGWAERWGNFSFYTYILVNKNSSPEVLGKKITDCYNSHQDTPASLHVEPLEEVYLNADVLNLLGPSGNKLYVKIFAIVAILLLVVACINYMNLATAKAIQRAKEVGLRKVIGARKREIVFQNIGESILIVFISFPIAIMMIEYLIPVFNNIIGKQLLINYLNPQIVLGMSLFVLLTGLFSGLYPAFYISSISPATILKNRTGDFGSRNALRKMLIVFQFTISILVIVCTMIISKQMRFIQNKNLGFDKENLLYAWVPGGNNEVLKTELLKNPNILNVGASGAQLDWLGWWSGINKWDGKEQEDYTSFGILEVGYDYLKTYKMEMNEGRYYSRDFPADQDNSIIVNQAAIKVMNLENPIGKTITYNDKVKTIIGVVKDFNYESLRKEIGPMLFVLYPKKLRCLGIRISGENIASTVNYINKVFEANILDDKIEVKFLDDQLNQLYMDETRRGTLFFYFSFITIFIALLGLFGLAAYSIERRKKEIGIRKVLGAPVLKITSTLTKEYLYWILVANLIAAPAAYYFMDEWLGEFAYKINIEITEFLIAGSFVLMVAFLTVGIKAVKAALINPVECLRYE